MRKGFCMASLPDVVFDDDLSCCSLLLDSLGFELLLLVPEELGLSVFFWPSTSSQRDV